MSEAGLDVKFRTNLISLMKGQIVHSTAIKQR